VRIWSEWKQRNILSHIDFETKTFETSVFANKMSGNLVEQTVKN
jgi:hypothetical protein